jgi:GntR family transcriptional regulator, carbon starvation induced regulator
VTQTLLDKTTASDTLSERAAALVEADILGNVFAPDARLGITELAERYGIGATPIREGLSRLVARGLIVAIGQRGFRVAAISRDDLEDITRLRSLIECEALRRSMRLGGGEWEGAIVAALHQLRRYAQQSPAGVSEGRSDFDHLHKGFHTALIAACGSPRMLQAQSDLYDQAFRYRRVMMRTFEEPRDFVATHEALAEVVIRRQAREAVGKLAAHLASTLVLVYPDDAGARA